MYFLLWQSKLSLILFESAIKNDILYFLCLFKTCPLMLRPGLHASLARATHQEHKLRKGGRKTLLDTFPIAAQPLV